MKKTRYHCCNTQIILKDTNNNPPLKVQSNVLFKNIVVRLDLQVSTTAAKHQTDRIGT